MKRAIISLAIGLPGIGMFAYGLNGVMKIGTCASGNSTYVIANPCPSGTGAKAGLLAVGIVLAVIGMIVGVGRTLLFQWSAMFLAGGIAALLVAVSGGHVGSGGKTAGYILGAIFIPMGGFPMIWVISNGLESLRSRQLRARSTEADATVSRVDELQRFGMNQAKIRVTYTVAPQDDVSFEVSRETSTLLTRMPHVGQKAKIRYDPRNHQRFELITPPVANTGELLAEMMRARTPTPAAASVAAATVQTAMPRRDPLDRLKELAQLRDSGALTTAEFEAQKAKILAET
jgi:Short C-terminal domain